MRLIIIGFKFYKLDLYIFILFVKFIFLERFLVGIFHNALKINYIYKIYL